jgi:5-methyltetrahydrofolate--homocysteine methyltransferase
MVEHEKIVAAALEKKVDIVALSGLITPSLDEMITVVRELKAAGLTVPVMIAGATTSPLHTALKIAPEYDGAVVHVKDVSQNVVVAAELLGDASRREAYIAGLKEMQDSLRQTAGQRAAAPLRSLEEARANKPNLF